MGGQARRHSMPTSSRLRPSRILRAGVALVAAVVLAATGAGWWTFRGMLSGITVSQALGADAPRSTGASINILLIGLDSRKDQNGNDLPQEMLDQLHAGDSSSGGYNTNTLILVHLAADGAVEAFSIPRDDYVKVSGIVPGYQHIKIKEAYGLTKADEEQKLADDGVTDQATLEKQGREAGRKATLAVVRALTGAPIDYFAEVNLAGFYDVAASLGGVEVCLNHAVHDDYSGADFPAGRQTLDAQQALAFVRQRHGLDNGDLDRTHRQQAFLISVIRQLQDSGSFSDVGKLNALMDVARKDIVLSADWDQSLFQRIGELAGAQVRYQTLPVVRYDNVDGQDVNIVDPSAIRALVASTFSDGSVPATPAPLAPSDVTVDVFNASGVTGMATETSNILTNNGYREGDVRGPLPVEPTTDVEYGTGANAPAQTIATMLGIIAPPRPRPDLPPGHVRVMLGDGYQLPADVSSLATAPSGGESLGIDVGASDASSDTPAPDQGLPISGSGIPCVN
ncbi:LCP family protein [Mycolicibacterium sp. 050158]|uniref:LCP family protein n=1 Tax=Mycolicibacterium sp. 050158 TaxID=3090602 RepID=UPI00299D38AB|nr:LCP family protein [Mycolicibacterium sp. 050158]MDX1889324.1 LCP family protein [Mycolicibacterium sp. 050158]